MTTVENTYLQAGNYAPVTEEVTAFDLPDDPGFAAQWHMQDTVGGMWAASAWGEVSSPGAGVTVAIIDTGVAGSVAFEITIDGVSLNSAGNLSLERSRKRLSV